MLKITFTVMEVARLLSCHPETLRRAIKEGTLRAAKLGREYRISRPDLQAFWTVCGGWELFGDLDPPSPPADNDKARKKKQSPRQLSLLAPEEKL